MTRASGPSRRHGANAVEFAFMVPILLLIIFAILEFARFLFTVQVCNNAVREGVRYAVSNASNGVRTIDVQNWVNTYLAGAGGQLKSFTATGSNGAPTSIWVYRDSNQDPTTGPPTGQPNTASWNNTTTAANGSVTDDWALAAYGTPIYVEIAGIYAPVVPISIPVFTGGKLTAVSLMPSSITFDSTQSQYASGTGSYLSIKCMMFAEAN